MHEVARRLRWAGVLLAVVGTLLWSARSISRAQLQLEDGACLFQRYYHDWAPDLWLSPFSGYVSLLPNVLASACCRLPVATIPAAFTAMAWLMNVLALITLLRPAFDGVLALRVRVVLVASLAWLPLGNHALSGLLMYSLMPLMLWLWLLLLQPQRGPVGRVVDALMVVLLTWSHPLAIVLAPIAAWRLR